MIFDWVLLWEEKRRVTSITYLIFTVGNIKDTKVFLTVGIDDGTSDDFVSSGTVALQRSPVASEVLQRQNGVGGVDGFGQALVDLLAVQCPEDFATDT